MIKIFGWSAGLWVLGVLMLIGIAAHHVLAHWFTFVWLTTLFVALPFGWRWLQQYKATASVAARIDAAEGKVWSKLMLHLEGSKSAILMFIVSGFSAAKDWIDGMVHTAFGLTPDQLDPFKDVGVLHAFFSDSIAPKIISGVTLFAAFLSIHSKLQAAKIVPASGSLPAP